LLLDDDDDLRAVLGELFGTFGVSCVGVGSVDDLIALGPRALDCDLAILDINLGPTRRSGLDAYEWLKGEGYRGRVVFLTGHAQSHPVVAKAYHLGVQVLEKPVSPQDLVRLAIDEVSGPQP
jgi:DNA-binding NtrC family response regulator